eukprot:TRINITY_DN1779_c0_g1_i2.p1 TRINITY_DN1779_c0_g1~~TRINITY_DN1779_c0_g1_i2.p1  ORF type:complete len:389 (-),score=26.22 TRINITY_DN1779_c0_g1_i2:279-1277(-)
MPTSEHRLKALLAEERMLQTLSIPYTQHDTHIGPHPENFIHYIQAGDITKPLLVCIPGYCAGAVMYYKNLSMLTEKYRAILVDWPGQGLSGRPPFTARNQQQAIDFFIHALEKWSKINGFRRMALLGHSMGGYIAAHYALRHPEQVDQVILACAAGISKKPDNYSPQLPSFWSMRGQLFRIVKGTWDWGITPPAVLRSVGPVGYHLVQNYTNTRLRDTFGWPQSESDLMRDYIYYMLSQRGCAEYALRHILEPMAWAKEPLEDKLTELQTPFAFIYAQNDFFTSDVALRINRKLKHQNKSTAKIEIIEDAGHIVYMQKPNEFVERVFNVCQN